MEKFCRVLSKIIRILTVPPVLVLTLFLTLYGCRPTVFRGVADFLVPVLCLAFVPALAYVLQPCLPHYRHRGREGQRNLAIILSALGYAVALIYGLVAGVSHVLLLIILTYFISIFLLVISNKVIRFRASGHACSVTGPMFLLIYLISWWLIFPCLALATAIVLSSLYLHRHTVYELTGGALCALISFLLSLLLTAL